MSTPSAQSKVATGKVSLGAPVQITLEQVHAASAKLNEALQASPATSHASIPGSQTKATSRTPIEEMEDGDYCEVCKSENDAPTMLLCDECDKGYHMYCLSPPLKKIPKGDWICDACIVNRGDDYAFGEGDEHTLASFQQLAHKFRKNWLASHPVAGIDEKELNKEVLDASKEEEEWEREAMVEDHVEREFWRIVAAPDEEVEVEYGADIHTTDMGRYASWAFVLVWRGHADLRIQRCADARVR